MPYKCPKCSRINSDDAKICIYCKTSLEGAEYYEPPKDVARMAQHFLGKGAKKAEPPPEKEPIQKAESPKPAPAQRPSLKVIPGGKSEAVGKRAAPAIRERADRYWVVLAPMEKYSQDVVKTLAEKLKMDPYYVKQRFATANPWVLRRFEEAEKAQELARELFRLGLDVYSISDGEIKEIPERIPVTKVSVEEDGLLFESGKDKIRIRWNEAILIVKGNIDIELTEESRTKRREKQVKRPGLRPMASDSWHYEIYDIYCRSGPGLRLSERDTNFTGLGKYRSPSSLRNLRWVIRQFEARSSVYIDDGYRRTLKEYKLARPRSDHIARRLGRLKEEQLAVKYLDNSEHYDDYSTLIFLHFRKLEG